MREFARTGHVGGCLGRLPRKTALEDFDKPPRKSPPARYLQQSVGHRAVRAQQASGWGRYTTVINDINQRSAYPGGAQIQAIQGLAPQCPFLGSGCRAWRGAERLCWWACWRSGGGESRRHHWLPGVACRPMTAKPKELRELLDRSCASASRLAGKTLWATVQAFEGGWPGCQVLRFV
jgi:hypothetical protein